MIYIPIGCGECAMTGYSGRIAVTEVLVTTPKIERAVAGNERDLKDCWRLPALRGRDRCGVAAAAQLVAGNT